MIRRLRLESQGAPSGGAAQGGAQAQGVEGWGGFPVAALEQRNDALAVTKTEFAIAIPGQASNP